MPYREAAPRNKRLWYVTAAYARKDNIPSHVCDWYWALEADDALELLIKQLMDQAKIAHRQDIWH